VKVAFFCRDFNLFSDLRNLFWERKVAERESWDLAGLVYTYDEVTYITSCDNRYAVKLTDEGVIFEFEGSREALQRLEPFRGRMVWKQKAERAAVLEVDGCSYELELIEYRTTTPPEWQLVWFDVVEPIFSPDPDNPTEARVLRDDVEIKRVPYKRVYPPKTRDC
jgi:hypothetical protein